MSPLPDPRRAERGSAYVLVLLALVVLTIIGLSLVLITQTEVQLGANERTANRTLYAAESGVDVAAARVLTASLYDPFTYIQNQTQVGNANIADQVQVTEVAPIATEPCDWCPVNEAGVPKFYKVNNIVSATARRVGWSGTVLPPASPRVYSQAQISAFFEFQPWKTPVTEVLKKTVDDKSGIQQIVNP